MNRLDVQIVILAGGLATRLMGLTQDTPKSLLPVAGKPFIDHQLSLVAQAGVRDVILCIAHLGGQIEAHVGDGSRWGLRVQYSNDGEVLLGTGGALKRAEGLLQDRFFLMWGDSYLLLDYPEIWHRAAANGYDATMVVYRNENHGDRSNVQIEGDRVIRYDKWSDSGEFAYIDNGISVLTKSTLKRIPAGEPFAIEETFRDLAKNGQLGAYVTSQRFYEVGSPPGIAELELLLKRKVSK